MKAPHVTCLLLSRPINYTVSTTISSSLHVVTVIRCLDACNFKHAHAHCILNRIIVMTTCNLMRLLQTSAHAHATHDMHTALHNASVE